MSKLATKKSGAKSSSFGGINTNKKGGTPGEWATIIATEALRLKLKPKIGLVQLVMDGLGTVDAENGFEPTYWTSNPAQLGPWAMNSSYGSVAQRLDKVASTRIALEHWKSDGESFVPGWWHWEDIQGETEDGHTRGLKYKRIAEEGIKRAGVEGYAGEPEGTLGEPKLPGQSIVEGAVSDAESVGDFLGELAETLFNFKKLGALAAAAMAWFLKLIFKAIWDYVIHPALDWVERATSWYWINFFGTGVERGSGVGYQLRNNAGIITIAFWAFGYGALFTDGESLAPIGKASNTMLGRQFKAAEGKIARRSLVKPSEVKEKTPDKPKPKGSTVPIERTQTFSVGRKRAVSVTAAGSTKITQGRKPDGSSERQRQTAAPVARPQSSQQTPQRLVLPPGVETPSQIKAKATAKRSPKQSGTRVDARSSSGSATGTVTRTGGKK